MTCTYGMIECSTKHKTPANRIDMADATARIRAWRAAASADDVFHGSRWYRDAGGMMADAAESAGLPAEAGAIVAAILSPRAPWDANVAAALAIMTGASTDGMTVLPARVALAREYVATLRVDMLGTSPKVRAFACNLAGCGECVTSDAWHVRAATGRRDGSIASCGCEHAAIAEATRTVAAEYGETAAQTQAIVWVAIRSVNPARGRVRTVVPV